MKEKAAEAIEKLKEGKIANSPIMLLNVNT